MKIKLDKAIVELIPETPVETAELEALQEQDKRLKQRQKEAKAHTRNVKKGKK